MYIMLQNTNVLFFVITYVERFCFSFFRWIVVEVASFAIEIIFPIAVFIV